MTVMTLSPDQRQDLARILAELRRTTAKMNLALSAQQPLVVVHGYVEALHSLTQRVIDMDLTIEDLVPFVVDPDPDAGLDDDRVMRILGLDDPGDTS